MPSPIEKDLQALEGQIALMRAAGKTHLPIPFSTVEKMIAAERKRYAMPAAEITPFAEKQAS
ncbi:MAG: hypothetical protein IT536_04390 [Hyphomicrobiales bacterium]|nr:hypothetical protein [Hyphomicrobiales bacterium]